MQRNVGRGDASELDEDAITRPLNGVDQIAAERAQPRKRPSSSEPASLLYPATSAARMPLVRDAGPSHGIPLARPQEFRRSYALARQCQAEDFAFETLAIAADSTRDYVRWQSDLWHRLHRAIERGAGHLCRATWNLHQKPR
jgi:hypothetical protein